MCSLAISSSVRSSVAYPLRRSNSTSFSDSVRDYDAAIGGLPEVASSWYVRGLAKRALGDAKGAEADIAKGLALDPKVGERYAGYGAQ